MRDKKKARTGGEKGRHLWPRFVQKIAEGKTFYDLGWKVKAMMLKNKYINNNMVPRNSWAPEELGG